MGEYELGSVKPLEDWIAAVPDDVGRAMLQWVTRLRVDPRGAAGGRSVDGAGNDLFIAYVEGADALVSYAVVGQVVLLGAIVS